MRTRFEIVLCDEDDPVRLRAAGEAALDEIERIDAQLSVHRDASELFRVNAQAYEQAVQVDRRVMDFLQESRALCVATAGAFDLAIGPLLRCWDHAGMAGPTHSGIPSDAAIAHALERCGMDRQLAFDESQCTVGFRNPGVRLDAGAIGKGYALQRAVQILEEFGVRSVIMHGGTSSVLARHRPPEWDQWRVAVRHPLARHPPVATALLSDRSLAISTPVGRSVQIGGCTYGHIIDPRSGWPVQGALLAGVIHPSAMVSDALSTALLVLGVDAIPMLKQRFAQGEFLLVHRTKEGGPCRIDIDGEHFVQDHPFVVHQSDRGR